MSYLVLSRKYRPQTFEEVVGQDHVTRTLKNAIASDRISHAYIFSGPRGIGKTTTARLLAKALNCEEGRSSEPCGKCIACTEITGSRNLDVLEIDGATYRGIDNIRDLQEYLSHPPVRERYKVVIIDEVHMLTKESFNALLKTVEEPPPNMAFIFATTQVQKVPATILSRCQRFDFKRITVPLIVQTLRDISGKESIKIDDDSLAFIAWKAEGGMRDALSLLDQAVSFSGGEVEYSQLKDILGMIDEEVLFEITGSAMSGDTRTMLELSKRLLIDGHDPEVLLVELLEHLRSMLIVAVSGDENQLSRSAELREKYLDEAKKFSCSDIMRMVQIVEESYNRINWSAMPRLVFESALLKMAAMDRSIILSELIERLGGTSVENVEQRADEVKEKPEPTPDTSAEHTREESEKKTESDDSTHADKNDGEIELKELAAKWEEILGKVGEQRSNLSASLSMAVPTDLNKRFIELTFPASSSFERDSIERNSGYVEGIIKELTGMERRIKTKVSEVDSSPAKADEDEHSEEETGENELSNNPIVARVIDLFGGKVTR